MEIVEEMKEQTGMSYGIICKTLQLPCRVLTDGGADSKENAFSQSPGSEEGGAV